MDQNPLQNIPHIEAIMPIKHDHNNSRTSKKIIFIRRSTKSVIFRDRQTKTKTNKTYQGDVCISLAQTCFHYTVYSDASTHISYRSAYQTIYFNRFTSLHLLSATQATTTHAVLFFGDTRRRIFLILTAIFRRRSFGDTRSRGVQQHE